MTIPVRGVARTPVPGPWQSATILQVRAETANAKTLRLMLADPRPHLADLGFWRRRHVPRW
jgi:hypothetical protein